MCDVFTCKVRNTQRQYLRVTLPNPSCNIWSVCVSDNAVKPSCDEAQKVLIPLEKSGMIRLEYIDESELMVLRVTWG